MPTSPTLARVLEAVAPLLELFERLPDVVCFAKDETGRYVAVNDTLVRRLTLGDASAALGRTTRDLFPAPLGERYLAQDLGVLRTGAAIVDLLELHLYPDRHEGWCVTNKIAVRDEGGVVVGLVGTSRDVHAPAAGGEAWRDLARAVQRIHEEYAEPLRVEDLAAEAQLSAYQFTRRIRALFGLTPGQLLLKTRIDAARELLRGGTDSVAQIAAASGFSDQSAFTRQFRAVTGLTPSQYRAHTAAND